MSPLTTLWLAVFFSSAAARSEISLRAISDDSSLRTRPANAPTQLARLRGGGILGTARQQALTLFYQRARRDDHRSIVLGGRIALGLWLLFQPSVHFGLTDLPVGRATAQLFFAAHFYLRLMGMLLAQSDFFEVPRSRRGKLRKRAVSSAIFLASLLSANFVGWLDDERSMARRALPSGLALGVVIARTATSVFDYVSASVREALRVLNVKRAIFQPEHASPTVRVARPRKPRRRRPLMPQPPPSSRRRKPGSSARRAPTRPQVRQLRALEATLHLESSSSSSSTTSSSTSSSTSTSSSSSKRRARRGARLFATQEDAERVALDEAADEARRAVERALQTKSKAQEAARKAAAQALSVQLVRTAIALATTAVGLRCACDESDPLARALLGADAARSAPALMALYAPALVGAFEVSQSLRELAHINEYQLSRLKFRLLALALGSLNTVLAAGRALVTAGRTGWGRVVAAEEAWEKATFGEEYFLLHFFTRSPPGVRIARALATLQSLLRRLLRATSVYRRAVKWLQQQVKGLVRDTQHDLWPWVLALAGYRVQTGQLRLAGVPGFLGRTFSYPVRLVPRYAAATWRGGLRLLRYLLSAPAVKVLELLARAGARFAPVEQLVAAAE